MFVTQEGALLQRDRHGGPVFGTFTAGKPDAVEPSADLEGSEEVLFYHSVRNSQVHCCLSGCLWRQCVYTTCCTERSATLHLYMYRELLNVKFQKQTCLSRFVLSVQCVDATCVSTAACRGTKFALSYPAHRSSNPQNLHILSLLRNNILTQGFK